MDPVPIKKDSDTSKDRRAQLAVLVGLVLQAVMFATLLGVALAYASPAIRAEAIHLQFGIYIWLILVLLYSQRRRAGVEQLETEELKRAREASADTGIFNLEDEAMLVQRRRLNWMYRWFLPGAALLLALGHILWSGWWWYSPAALPIRDPGWKLCTQPQLALPFVVGATFFCYLYSRYATGMARRAEWRLLRAASSYLAGNAFLGLVTVVGLALSIYEVRYAEPVVTYVIYLGMLVLGIEFLLNFVLDFYRPRIAGADQRPAFDSRLLGLISEPSGIARSIQEAINYQFGFEVSSTWFYQLLKRSLLPLLWFAVVVLIGLSSLVIVDTDEQAFVEHFGQVVQARNTPLEPGPHLKWPWPVDVVRRERVRQLRPMTVGEAAKKKGQKEGEPPTPVVLWTEEHEYVPELMLLVACPQLTTLGGETTQRGEPPQDAPARHLGRSVAVSLIMASVDLEYRISDLYAYTYQYVNPEAVIGNVAYRVLADHAAGIDITRFMGPEREQISRELRTLLQGEFDRLNLGVELTFVGLQSAHPTWKENVAKKFQDVIAAKSRKETKIQAATGEAERMLTRAAGSRERALALDQAIVEMNGLSADPAADPAGLATAKTRVHELLLGNAAQNLAQVSGEAAATIAQAQAEVSQSVSEAESRARTFQNELIAYEAAPQLYKMRRYLEVLENSLKSARKIINSTRNTNLVVIIETEKKSEFELPKPEEK